jgi:hypothetical protein
MMTYEKRSQYFLCTRLEVWPLKEVFLTSSSMIFIVRKQALVLHQQRGNISQTGAKSVRKLAMYVQYCAVHGLVGEGSSVLSIYMTAGPIWLRPADPVSQ